MDSMLYYILVLAGTLVLAYIPVRIAIWVVHSWTKATRKPLKKTKKNRTLVKNR